MRSANSTEGDTVKSPGVPLLLELRKFKGQTFLAFTLPPALLVLAHKLHRRTARLARKHARAKSTKIANVDMTYDQKHTRIETSCGGLMQRSTMRAFAAIFAKFCSQTGAKGETARDLRRKMRAFAAIFAQFCGQTGAKMRVIRAENCARSRRFWRNCAAKPARKWLSKCA